MLNALHVETMDWTRAKPLAAPIRKEVFIVEQNVPESEEWDKWDDFAVHALAILDGEAIGTARLTREGRIGRMAVKRAHRKIGVGSALLSLLIEEAKERALAQLSLYAQTHAQDFYTHFGFEPVGDVFDEAGIEHILMERHLHPPVNIIKNEQAEASHLPTITRTEKENALSPEALQSLIRTQSFQALRMASETDVLNAFHAFLVNTRNTLDILFPNLSPTLFNQPPVIEHLLQIVKGNRNSRVRCLVEYQPSLIKQRHEFIERAKRLSSACDVRILHEDDINDEALIIFDRFAYITMPSYKDYIGTATLSSPQHIQSQQERFNRLWQNASAHPDFKRLFI